MTKTTYTFRSKYLGYQCGVGEDGLAIARFENGRFTCDAATAETLRAMPQFNHEFFEIGGDEKPADTVKADSAGRSESESEPAKSGEGDTGGKGAGKPAAKKKGA